MTVRKQWLIVLIIVALLSISINTFILSSLTDKYFVGYIKKNYEKHYEEILEYTNNALSTNVSIEQMNKELKTHLIDPITEIIVYDSKGNVLLDVTSEEYYSYGMMNGRMGKGMMGRMMKNQQEEVEQDEIIQNGSIIGYIDIVKYSSEESSIVALQFKSSLLKNSIISIFLVLFITIILGILISQKMSKELKRTAKFAQSIDMGDNTNNLQSRVKEIRVIQQSLESLSTRLKIKQKSRKSLVDQLVHQTRTPLTILKTHLEGIEDGIIQMTPDEINVCYHQIDNINTIITNMSGLIDADINEDELKLEEINIQQLLKQIVSGLSVQFEKKKINLLITEQSKMMIQSDKYKLSQVIYNLLTNAYKYTKPGGSVLIHYEMIDDKLIISVKDNGIGIQKEEQDRIFDAYYKGTSHNTTGEGIGLYIVKENLKSLHGTIHVESKINKGSMFTISLPVKSMSFR